MTVDFRSASPADRDAILALRRLAYPGEDVAKQSPEYWSWQFERSHAGAARVFVAEERGLVVSHFAFVPQQYAIEGELLRGALACDVMTHPEFRGRGIFRRLGAFAVEQLRNEFQVVTAFQIREGVRSGMLANGWREHSGHRISLRPASLRALLRGPDRSTQPAAAADASLSNRALTARIAQLLEQPGGMVAQPRSAEFLRWRYAELPSSPYRVAHASRATEVDAFVLYRDARLRGMDTLCICEAAHAPGSETLLNDVVRRVIREARSRSMQLIASFTTHQHPLRRVLLRQGMMPGPHRFRFLLQTFDPALERLHTRPWSLTWGDTDHL